MTRSRQQATEGRHSEQGSALIVSLLSTTLLLVLGSALALVAQSESAIAANAPRDAQTLYAAEAAVRHAAVDLEALPDWSIALAGMATSTFTDGSPGGVRFAGLVNVDLTMLGATLNAGAAGLPFGANNPQWTLYLWGRAEALLVSSWPGYVAVWVADDASEEDDDPLRDGVERMSEAVEWCAYGRRRSMAPRRIGRSRQPSSGWRRAGSGCGPLRRCHNAQYSRWRRFPFERCRPAVRRPKIYGSRKP